MLPSVRRNVDVLIQARP